MSGGHPGDVLAAGLLGRTGTGTFSVAIGRRWRDRLLARCLGHRRAGLVPFGLTVVPTAGGQRWVRSIGGREVAASTIVYDVANGTLVETFFGVLRLVLQPTVDGEGVLVESLGGLIGAGPVSLGVPSWLLLDVSARTRPRPDGSLWVRVAVRSRRGPDILTYEGVLS